MMWSRGRQPLGNNNANYTCRLRHRIWSSTSRAAVSVLAWLGSPPDPCFHESQTQCHAPSGVGKWGKT